MRPNVSFRLAVNTRVVLNGDVRRVKKRITSQKLFFNSEAKINTIHNSERERKESIFWRKNKNDRCYNEIRDSKDKTLRPICRDSLTAD